MIYLDNAATTPLDPEVLDAMLPYLRGSYGNPGGLYKLGRDANTAVENARIQVAKFIGSKPDQVVFTSGGSEGNNLVFFGLRRHLDELGKKHLIVSAVEHDSVLKAAGAMASSHGFFVSRVMPTQACQILPTEVESAITSDTGIVSVMFSNNETGVTNHDLDKIAEISHRYGSLFHTDAVQAAGFYDIDVEKTHCDFMTVSSHKLHGPKGVGAVFIRGKEIVDPLIYGGSHQEFGLRGGTENVAGIVGFGKACEIAQRDLETNRLKIEEAAMAFLFLLSSELGSNMMTWNGIDDIVGNKTVNLLFNRVDAETLILLLDANGVCASAGSACCSLEHTPSHVLTAMGLSAS